MNQPDYSDSTVMDGEKKSVVRLHRQLHNETENIIRWKAVTEIKTKNLERQVEEAHTVTDDQRRNLMDLKHHSEHLSQTLSHERQQNELLLTKVNHAREMFLFLKEQYKQLFTSASHFQEIRKKLLVDHECNLLQLAKFKDISAANMSTIANLIEQGQENKCTLEKLKEVSETRLIAKDDELKNIANILVMLCDDQMEMTEKLTNGEVNLATALDKKSAMECQLEKVRTSLAGVLSDLKTTTDTLTSRVRVAEEKLKLETDRVKESCSEFEEAAEKIMFLKKRNDLLEGASCELSEKVSFLTSQNQMLEQDIALNNEALRNLEEAHSSDLLKTETSHGQITELSSQLAALEPKCKNLKLDNENIQSEVGECLKSINAAQQQADKLEEQVPVMKDEMEELEQTIIQLREQRTLRDQHYTQLGVTINEQKLYLSDMCEEIDKLETHISEIEESKTHLEGQTSIVQDDCRELREKLNSKTTDCEKLSEEVENMKHNLEVLEKEITSKSKYEVNKSNTKKMMTEKIDLLETQLKDQMEHLESMQKFWNEQEEVLSERQQTLEGKETCLKEFLCEQKKLKSVLESKNAELNTVKDMMTKDIDTLRTDLEDKNAELRKILEAHRQEMFNLQNMLREIQTQSEEELGNFKEQQQRELDDQQRVLKELQDGTRKAREGAKAARNETLNIKRESDSEVKELVNLLERCKSEKETRLKEVREKIQMCEAEVAQLFSEKEALQSEKNKLKNMTVEVKKVATSQKQSVSTVAVDHPELIDPPLNTPSPSEYLPSLQIFLEPEIPKSLFSNRKIQDSKQIKGPEKTRILKNGRGGVRRVLLPQEIQKRMVFRAPLGSQEGNSDSSSDAWAFEVADNDDPFEEIRRSGRPRLTSKMAVIPRANIAPFIHTPAIPATNTEPSSDIAIQHSASLSGYQRDKQGRANQAELRKGEQSRFAGKTYRSHSPRFKCVMAHNPLP
ncbi:hypothetical protein Pcinc_013934 [Petrolisthes cinctipes]|uniref:Synaptonemal complex protein 1 n=1 Tax=Petrolisthes cinctipes TaxID=88211 RepID=A0AAE1KR59_PETCI|nr:hypothetical protein Pcinc_013934 [Petrolisthes cinctipes]